MAVFGEVQITVTTDVLRDKAQAVSNSIGSVSESFQELERIISRTGYYWIGEAGDVHRRIYKNQSGRVEEMLKRLKEHPKDLLSIARVYDVTEQETASIGGKLPGDVIS